jgi:uncharacterized membrane protein
VRQPEINEREWNTPGNWHGGWLGICSSEQDTRLLVPKRRRFLGWTLNQAHPGARFLLGLLLGAAVLALLAGRRS